MQLSKINNFDGIRLFASIQVLLIHASEHLHVIYPQLGKLLISVLRFFPGVPVFFTISGFLIMWSYDRNKKTLLRFYYNRLLRIYPALWVCLIVTVLILLGFHVLAPADLYTKEMIFWVMTQASFLQFYTPSLLRGFGVGTPNGSLWTISLELQFYVLVPLLSWIIISTKKRFLHYVYTLGIIALSVLTYAYANCLGEDTMLHKLMGVFILPYLYNFIFGVLIYKHWNVLQQFLLGKGGYWLLFYLLYSFVFSWGFKLYTPSYWPNPFGFIANLILAFTMISLAYTATSCSDIILKRNDFSYGIYIYHMLVVNVFVSLGYTGSMLYVASVFFITLLAAVLSWFLIERNALKFK